MQERFEGSEILNSKQVSEVTNSFIHSLIHLLHNYNWIPPAVGIMLATGNPETAPRSSRSFRVVSPNVFP